MDQIRIIKTVHRFIRNVITTSKYTYSFIFVIPFLFLPILIQKVVITLASSPDVYNVLSEDKILEVEKQLRLEISKLNIKLDGKIPKSNYLIINTSENDFSLYKGKKLIHKDKCSTGSYTLLKNGDQQEWMFKTPKGEFKILSKTTSPIWKKPDWAFIEVGLPVPSKNHWSRFEYGVLGDYALNLGQGYLIHGTLYQRFLGLPVTHGCVRLSDANLKLVYTSLNQGSKVYIY